MTKRWLQRKVKKDKQYNDQTMTTKKSKEGQTIQWPNDDYKEK
jgi:hypothetical protein